MSDFDNLLEQMAAAQYVTATPRTKPTPSEQLRVIDYLDQGVKFNLDCSVTTPAGHVGMSKEQIKDCHTLWEYGVNKRVLRNEGGVSLQDIHEDFDYSNQESVLAAFRSGKE